MSKSARASSGFKDLCRVTETRIGMECGCLTFGIHMLGQNSGGCFGGLHLDRACAEALHDLLGVSYLSELHGKTVWMLSEGPGASKVIGLEKMDWDGGQRVTFDTLQAEAEKRRRAK